MKIPCHRYREVRRTTTIIDREIVDEPAAASESPPTPAQPPAPAPRKEILPIAFLPYTIIIDTREQTPWPFRDVVDTIKQQRTILVARSVREGLKTGDYSIVGCEDKLTIERKSGDDIISSVSYGRDRFLREHQRMQAMIAAGGCACVVIEAPLTEIQKTIADRQGKFTFQSFWKTYVSWMTQFCVPWLFCQSRRGAELTAFHIMKSYWKHHAGGGNDG